MGEAVRGRGREKMASVLSSDDEVGGSTDIFALSLHSVVVTYINKDVP